MIERWRRGKRGWPASFPVAQLPNAPLLIALGGFVVAAATSFLLSIALWFTDNEDEAVFVGLWVPSILAAGGFWIVAVRTR